MKEKHLNILWLCFKIILSLSIICAGLCLIYGVLCIYFIEGEYSRQIVADTFKSIAVPVYIGAGLSAISLFLPLVNEKSKTKISPKFKLELLNQRKDLSALTENNKIFLKKQQKNRKLIQILEALVIAVSIVAFLIYGLNGNNYTKDINASVINAMYVLLPCLLAVFITTAICESFKDKSYKAETDILIKLPSLKTEPSKADKKLLVIRCIILLAAILMLVLGLATGGVYDVLTKAVNICTECIGLG